MIEKKEWKSYEEDIKILLKTEGGLFPGKTIVDASCQGRDIRGFCGRHFYGKFYGKGGSFQCGNFERLFYRKISVYRY